MAAAGDITKALGARWHGATGTARCPAHDDRNPSLSISEGQDGTPLVYCHAGCSQEAVISALRERGLWHLGFGTSPRPAAKVAKVAKAPRAHITDADARALWRRGLQAQGTPVETYLRHRGFTGPIPPTIRYLPAAKHRSGTRHPTMIAAVTRVPSRRVIAVHRTFLAPDGAGKALVTPVKMAYGPVSGGAVRLAPAGEHLAVAEGVETALSVMDAAGVVTWAALSAGGMKRLILPPLPLASMVTICADADATGIAAAHDAADRWTHEGRRVRIATPPKGQDFNDIYRRAAP